MDSGIGWNRLASKLEPADNEIGKFPKPAGNKMELAGNGDQTRIGISKQIGNRPGSKLEPVGKQNGTGTARQEKCNRNRLASKPESKPVSKWKPEAVSNGFGDRVKPVNSQNRLAIKWNWLVMGTKLELELASKLELVGKQNWKPAGKT